MSHSEGNTAQQTFKGISHVLSIIQTETQSFSAITVIQKEEHVYKSAIVLSYAVEDVPWGYKGRERANLTRGYEREENISKSSAKENTFEQSLWSARGEDSR